MLETNEAWKPGDVETKRMSKSSLVQCLLCPCKPCPWVKLLFEVSLCTCLLCREKPSCNLSLSSTQLIWQLSPAQQHEGLSSNVAHCTKFTVVEASACKSLYLCIGVASQVQPKCRRWAASLWLQCLWALPSDWTAVVQVSWPQSEQYKLTFQLWSCFTYKVI